MPWRLWRLHETSRSNHQLLSEKVAGCCNNYNPSLSSIYIRQTKLHALIQAVQNSLGLMVIDKSITMRSLKQCKHSEHAKHEVPTLSRSCGLLVAMTLVTCQKNTKVHHASQKMFMSQNVVIWGSGQHELGRWCACWYFICGYSS